MASSEPSITPLSLLMTKDDFDCPEVLNAVNPHPVTGYAHGMICPNHNKKILLHSVLTILLSGPIPNNNRGWIPMPVIDRSLAARRPVPIMAADIAEGLTKNPPPNPMVKLNKENGLVYVNSLEFKLTPCEY